MIVSVSGDTLDRAAAILKAGGSVAFPTETVYGLGGDAFNPRALARIFAAKERPFFDPLIIHIADMKDLEKAADPGALSPAARRRFEVLSSKFWPGPLTLILPRRPLLPDLATSGLATAALRFPSHPAAQELIRRVGAVAAPSANRFGCLSPIRAEHVEEQLGEKIDLVLDGGRTCVGLESTVLDLCGAPRILRPGGLVREAIEEAIGPVAVGPAGGNVPAGDPASPGMLKSHYAPLTPLVLCGSWEDIPGDPSAALLFFSDSSREKFLARFAGGAFGGVVASELRLKVLSGPGDKTEAAANFFDALHELDRAGFSRIYAEKAPDGGLGDAINDRLSRASFFKK
jgi:L-threonylcarbamoyladenylate synthase